MESLKGVWLETSSSAHSPGWRVKFDETKMRLVNLFTGAVLEAVDERCGENITELKTGGEKTYIDASYESIKKALQANSQILEL